MEHGARAFEHAAAVSGEMADMEFLVALLVALGKGVERLDPRHVTDAGVGHVDDDGPGLRAALEVLGEGLCRTEVDQTLHAVVALVAAVTLEVDEDVLRALPCKDDG